MAKRTLSDKLMSVAPPSVIKPGVVVNTIPDLQRILALPRRPPVVCERDPLTRQYPAATQALIEIETAKFSRGPRVSCGCRPRTVVLGRDGVLTIFRQLPEDVPPEAPVRTTVAAFAADHSTLADSDVRNKVAAMQPGEELQLPAVDGEHGHPCIVELAPTQAWFLREAAQEGGAVGFLGVGSGKSICFLLAPLLFPDSRLAVLLIEPKQRHHYRTEYVRLREHFRVSSIVCDVEIPRSTVPGTVPLHLISYSVLSRTENSDRLDRLAPDTLLIDEAHRACGTSAINRRVKRYATSCIKRREEAMARGEVVRSRALRLLNASGTLEVKSVNDTQMLCAFSLGMGSPVPIDPNEAEAWSSVMDVQHQPDRKSATARALHRVFGKGYVEKDASLDLLLADPPEKALRVGFQKWRSETPGIVTAAASDINASLYVDELEVPEMPKVVRDALADVRVNSRRPDGDELVEKVEQLACAKNVACGFYPYWAFPKHPCACPADRTPTRSDNWCDQCVLIDDWYACRKKFNKELRLRLQHGELQLDSPKLCEEAAVRAWEGEATELLVYCDTCWRASRREVRWPCEARAHRPAWREESWPAWFKIRDCVEYEERVKWLGHDSPEAKSAEMHPGYFLARHLAEWGRKNKGVIWFQSVPLGRKISELGKLPYFNGGPHGEERLRAEKGDRSIVVSISAHGAGTNGLQELFNEQVLAEMPPSNATTHGVEQIFGRLHRRGQKKDSVITHICLHAYEFRDAFRKAIEKAEFNYQMSNIRPKILMADRDIDEL
jgi:hypothetical protein